ncbi:MAG: Lrp/AsnC family transcriptional regulator [Pseudomonadota bacterium]|nr:Lrp/AsnC family transcriptional regulator [Pseudomonadota bacterium]
MQIDGTDRALLTALSDDARRSVADLARDLGLARSTVQTRIDRLERSGAIAGYTLRLGQSVRAAVRATVLMTVEPRSEPEVLKRLTALREIDSVITTSGRYDLMAQLSAPTTESINDALDQIVMARGVKSTESLIHLSVKLDRSR